MSKRKAKRVTRSLPLSASRHRERMRKNAADFLAAMIGQPDFEEVLHLFQEIVGQMSMAEQQQFTVEMQRRIAIMNQQRENGQMLAEDGRAKRKPITDKRTAHICRLYQKVRKLFDAGGRGNGAALREVCRRYGSLPGREKQITAQAVRDALKRGGVVCK